MFSGTLLSFSQGVKPTFAFTIGSQVIAPYIGLIALAVNLFVTLALSYLFDRIGVERNPDATTESDYATA
jgi:SSS family solute:Na+ symporter